MQDALEEFRNPHLKPKPPNRHMYATELFFVLKGEGQAMCDDKTILIQEGDSLLVPSMGTHIIENAGKGRLYTLTIMVPNEEFTELIHSGIPENWMRKI